MLCHTMPYHATPYHTIPYATTLKYPSSQVHMPHYTAAMHSETSVQNIVSLYFSHDVGSGTVENKSDKKLTMNHWHKIRIVRRGNTAEVSIDTTTARSRRSIIPSSILNVDNRFYLGGLEARKERYNNYITRCLIAHSDKFVLFVLNS